MDTTASIFFLFVSPSNGTRADRVESARRLTCGSAAIGLLVLSSVSGLATVCASICCHIQKAAGWQWDAILALFVFVSNVLSVGAAVWMLANKSNDICSRVAPQSLVVFPTLASSFVAAVVPWIV